MRCSDDRRRVDFGDRLFVLSSTTSSDCATIAGSTTTGSIRVLLSYAHLPAPGTLRVWTVDWISGASLLRARVSIAQSNLIST